MFADTSLMVKFTRESNRTEMDVEPLTHKLGSVLPKSLPTLPLSTVKGVPGVWGVIFQMVMPGVQTPFSTVLPRLPLFVMVTTWPWQTVSFGEMVILAIGLSDTYMGTTEPAVVPQGLVMER